MLGRIYERYCAKQIYFAVIFILLAFVGLFIFFDLLSALGDAGTGRYSAVFALIYVLLQAPTRFYEILPLATLIGSIYVFAQLANHSEFTILRVAGLSTSSALRSALKIGFPLVIATYLIGELLSPYTAQLAEKFRLEALGQNISTGFRSGIWVKDKMTESGTGNRFVNIRSLQPDHHINGIDIFEFDEDTRLNTIIQAEAAHYQGQGQWLLKNVTRTDFQVLHPDAVLAPAHQTQLHKLPQLQIRSELTPQILEVFLLPPDRMALIDLFLYVRHLHNNKQDSRRYDIALWKKLVYPLTVLIMMALALPFAYLHARGTSIGLKVFGGIMLGMSFQLINNLVAHIGQLNYWAAPLTALLPAMLYLTLALTALYWVERH